MNAVLTQPEIVPHATPLPAGVWIKWIWKIDLDAGPTEIEGYKKGIINYVSGFLAYDNAYVSKNSYKATEYAWIPGNDNKNTGTLSVMITLAPQPTFMAMAANVAAKPLNPPAPPQPPPPSF